MTKSEKELFQLTKLSCYIALDNFKEIEILIGKLKYKNFKAIKIYETILHSYLFCGFPAAIESLKIFKKYYKHYKSIPNEVSNQNLKKSGEINCKLIYKNNYNKLLENMNRISPEMKNWMLFEGYGKVMSRTGLSLYEREFITISILTVRYFEYQLHSHLKGCIHLGAHVDLIKEILFSIKDIAGVTNYKKALKLLSRIHKPVDNSEK